MKGRKGDGEEQAGRSIYRGKGSFLKKRSKVLKISFSFGELSEENELCQSERKE